MANPKLSAYDAICAAIKQEVLAHGEALCANLLSYPYPDVSIAAQNEDFAQLITYLDRPYQLHDTDELMHIFKAQAIKMLCMAACHEMRIEALSLTDRLLQEQEHEALYAIKNALRHGDIAWAKTKLGVTKIFGFNPMTRDLEHAYGPPAGYIKLAADFNKAQRQDLMQLAWRISRMPDTLVII